MWHMFSMEYYSAINKNKISQMQENRWTGDHPGKQNKPVPDKYQSFLSYKGKRKPERCHKCRKGAVRGGGGGQSEHVIHCVTVTSGSPPFDTITVIVFKGKKFFFTSRGPIYGFLTSQQWEGAMHTAETTLQTLSFDFFQGSGPQQETGQPRDKPLPGTRSRGTRPAPQRC